MYNPALNGLVYILRRVEAVPYQLNGKTAIIKLLTHVFILRALSIGWVLDLKKISAAIDITRHNLTSIEKTSDSVVSLIERVNNISNDRRSIT